MAANKRCFALLSKATNMLMSGQRQNSSTNTKAAVVKFDNMVNKDYEEVTIPVAWGHIAGKWYGPKHVRPLVGLHGWQDNAGTFDTLAPLLPKHLPFLSLDLPGHGLSTWLPPGIVYHSIDCVSIIRRLMDEYNWDKISIMGHSMSSFNGFIFSAIFPDKVDMFIGLDVLKPPIRSPSSIVNMLGERLESILKQEQRLRSGSKPPSYSWDELEERLIEGSNKSVSKAASKFILQRNCKPSKEDPDKFYFSRDARLKNSMFNTFAHEVPLEMATRIKCPHLFIKSRQSPYYERKEYFDETLAILRKNPKFEDHEVDGTHHVHLNEPTKVAPIINKFINKWRPL